MTSSKDWHRWHEPYEDPCSPLSRRLRIVQAHLHRELDRRPREPIRVLSVCAGQGRDLIPVLASRADAGRVRAFLLDYDERNAGAAAAAARAAGLSGVDVLVRDAGDRASYAGLVPADVIVLAGVLGNVADADVRRTVAALPGLCAPGAAVVWTRSRRPPDLTPAVRAWFAEAGFVEEAFDAPEDVLFSVGLHRFAGEPQPLAPGRRLFSFAG
ncbi:MAG: class I SAM-dependent methyltransferase family protein [Actinomycetota bacterium]|nr:class I SAM-dependent methyltransferase family protein [Actinomycetota bacterium]